MVRHQAFKQMFYLLSCLSSCNFHAFDPFNMLQYLVAFSAKLPGQETAMSVEKTQTLTPIQITNFNAEMEPARR